LAKPRFSVVLIGKNEEKTLPRLVASLAEFQKRGGEIVLVDTGSTDKTVEVAEGLGCKVTPVGDRFVLTVGEDEAQEINEKFIEPGEAPVIAGGDRCFNFAAARNFAASLSSTDVIAMPDCDEIYTKLDIDKVDAAIADGVEQLEYNFVFAHDPFGNEAVKFWHSKFYDRRKLHWEGIIHEILCGAARRQFFEEDVIKLEHYQNPEQQRGHYLKGLALDCFGHPDNDRNSHYFARELAWNGRPKSAIKEFKRHIAMDRWPQERGESMLFVGDCCGMLGLEAEQVEWYQRSFNLDASRRSSLMRLAGLYAHKVDPQRVACYCAAALQVPWSGFYSNNMSQYAQEPHELMYWAKHQLGDIAGAREHWRAALGYQMLNPKYLSDAHWYVKLPKVSIVIPTLGREEGLKRCLTEIERNANYPKELYEVIVVEDSFDPEKRMGALKALKKGVEQSTGELVMFLANDTVPYPNFLIVAVLQMWLSFGDVMDGLVGLNDMYWRDGRATHWLGSKKLLPMLGGEFFHTGYYHVGCDDELVGRCRMAGKYVWCKDAMLWHNHPVLNDFSRMDDVNKLAWDEVRMKHDRELLAQRSKEFGFPVFP